MRAVSNSLLARILQSAEARPSAPALLADGTTMSYGELVALAESYATLLGLQPGEGDAPLCILARKSPTAVALVLGCLMAGRQFLLPANDLPSWTLADLVERAGCTRIVTPDTDAIARFPGLAVEHVASGDGRWCRTPPLRAPDAVSFMLTTSGSTGQPKVVPLPDDAIGRFVAWAGKQVALGPGGTTLAYAPLNFDLCLLDIWATLAHGGQVLLVDQVRATNGTYLLDEMERHPVTTIQAVPMFYRLLAEATTRRAVRFDRVETVIFTGDAMPAPTLAALPRLFPHARLFNIYGCTETNDSFIAEIAAAEADLAHRISIGRPLPGVSALVVDPERGVIDGPGKGELWVATPFQARAYLGTPGAEKFVRVDGPDGPRTYFRSGDFVERQADGRFALEGRMDFHIKVRGIRINLQDVERVILQHADVVEGAVIAVPDVTSGHRLHAQVRRRASCPLHSLTLFQHCARQLGRAAVPSSIAIGDEPLPKTSTGKVDRRLILHTHIGDKSHVV